VKLNGLQSLAMPPPAMTLNLLTQSECSRPRYKRDLILAQIFTKMWYLSSTLWSLLTVTLTLTFLSQNLISTSTNPNTSVTKIWYDVHKVFGALRAMTLTRICFK